MPRYNPFRPGSIVTPGMFSGRVEEIVALERVLFQTKNGNPDHFLIQGERGIGKSSLLFYTQCNANAGGMAVPATISPLLKVFTMALATHTEAHAAVYSRRGFWSEYIDRFHIEEFWRVKSAGIHSNSQNPIPPGITRF